MKKRERKGEKSLLVEAIIKRNRNFTSYLAYGEKRNTFVKM